MFHEEPPPMFRGFMGDMPVFQNATGGGFLDGKPWLDGSHGAYGPYGPYVTTMPRYMPGWNSGMPGIYGPLFGAMPRARPRGMSPSFGSIFGA